MVVTALVSGLVVTASGLVVIGTGASVVSAAAVTLRLQPRRAAILDGVLAPGERFAACVCNPPFHASAAEARGGSERKRLHGAHSSVELEKLLSDSGVVR